MHGAPDIQSILSEEFASEELAPGVKTASAAPRSRGRDIAKRCLEVEQPSPYRIWCISWVGTPEALVPDNVRNSGQAKGRLLYSQAWGHAIARGGALVGEIGKVLCNVAGMGCDCCGCNVRETER